MALKEALGFYIKRWLLPQLVDSQIKVICVRLGDNEPLHLGLRLGAWLLLSEMLTLSSLDYGQEELLQLQSDKVVETMWVRALEVEFEVRGLKSKGYGDKALNPKPYAPLNPKTLNPFLSPTYLHPTFGAP